MDVKYPDITVKLAGEDGNAFAIMGAVTKALRRAHVPRETVDQFRDEAMADDHDNLLQTVMMWVNTKVAVNRAFSKGKLDAKQVGNVLALAKKHLK